ncbi:transposable element Tc1 transposase [Trichonephila clavipes]|nr:transposable element Tc1 transposase [Trichonephila clavipes]
MTDAWYEWLRQTAQLLLDNWQHSGQQLQVFHYVLHQFRDVCCSVGCAQGFLYAGFLSRKTIATCSYNGPMCIGAGVLIGSRSSFSDESRFNLWHHDGRIRVMRYAGERHIPECNIERHNRRTPGVMVWGAIAYHGRSQLLRIVGNLNSSRYINEVLQPQAILFLQGLPGALFQQDNARPHVAKTVKSYLDSQQV